MTNIVVFHIHTDIFIYCSIIPDSKELNEGTLQWHNDNNRTFIRVLIFFDSCCYVLQFNSNVLTMKTQFEVFCKFLPQITKKCADCNLFIYFKFNVCSL